MKLASTPRMHLLVLPVGTPRLAPPTEIGHISDYVTQDYDESSSLLPGRNVTAFANRKGHFGRSIFYGAQVFYSFFIM